MWSRPKWPVCEDINTCNKNVDPFPQERGGDMEEIGDGGGKRLGEEGVGKIVSEYNIWEKNKNVLFIKMK